MTSRRTFLRVLGAAVVGAVVAPHIPLPASIADVGADTWWRSQQFNGPPTPLSFDMMRQAFEHCSRGTGAGPTHIITTRAVAESYARLCGLVFDMDLAA